MAESSPGGLRSPWRLTPASSKRTSGNRPPSYERAGRVPGKGGGARGRGRVRHRPPRPAGCEPRRPAGAGHRGAGTQRGGKVDGATGALRPPPARPGHRPPGRRGHHRRPAAPPPPTRHRLPPAGAVGVPGAHRAREPGARGLDLRGRPGEAPAGPRRHLRPLPAARRLEAEAGWEPERGPAATRGDRASPGGRSPRPPCRRAGRGPGSRDRHTGVRGARRPLSGGQDRPPRRPERPGRPGPRQLRLHPRVGAEPALGDARGLRRGVPGPGVAPGPRRPRGRPVMVLLLQAVADGVLLGLLYTVMAVGLSLTLGVLGVVDRVLIRRVARAPQLLGLLVLFGVMVAVESAAILLWTTDTRVITVPYTNRALHLGAITLSEVRLIAGGIALLLVVLLHAGLRLTRFGKAIRAMAQNRDVAMVLGIDVGWLSMVVFGLGTATAGAGGVVLGMVFPFDPQTQIQWLSWAFLVVLFGGLGGVGNTLAGGLT